METKAQSKFLEAATEFCKQEIGIRERRRNLRKCEEFDPADHTTKYPGNAHCILSSDNLCGAYRTRVESRPDYDYSVRKRSQAKQRMIYWAKKFPEVRA